MTDDNLDNQKQLFGLKKLSFVVCIVVFLMTDDNLDKQQQLLGLKKLSFVVFVVV